MESDHRAMHSIDAVGCCISIGRRDTPSTKKLNDAGHAGDRRRMLLIKVFSARGTRGTPSRTRAAVISLAETPLRRRPAPVSRLVWLYFGDPALDLAELGLPGLGLGLGVELLAGRDASPLEFFSRSVFFTPSR